MMCRIQLSSVALVVGVYVASPMVHTPPLVIEHPRLPVARGAEVHRLAIMQGAMQAVPSRLVGRRRALQQSIGHDALAPPAP
jgi:hypothetical protein